MRAAGIDPVMSKQVLELSVGKAMRLPRDASTRAEPPAFSGFRHYALDEPAIEPGVVRDHEIRSGEQISNPGHTQPPAAKLGHGKAMGRLDPWIDGAFGFSEPFICRHLSKPSTGAVKEQPRELDDLVVLGEACSLGVDDQQVHVRLSRELDRATKEMGGRITCEFGRK